MNRDYTPLTTAEAHARVEQILSDAGVTYAANYIRETVKDGKWQCDQWATTFTATSGARMAGVGFDYYTGLGHRRPNDSTAAKLSAMSLAKVSKRTLAWADHYKQFPDKPVAPHAATVIHSILLDSSAAEETFASWCDNFGYDTDSRKALATYEACQSEWDKFRKVFTPAQIQELRDALQDY